LGFDQMTDSRDQEQSAFLADSKLAKRLMRRAKVPVGVIGVGHALRLHGRASFLAGRSAVVDGLIQRYGVNRDHGAAAEGSASFGPMPWSFPAGRALPESIASGSALISPRSPEPSASQYTVRRAVRHPGESVSSAPAPAAPPLQSSGSGTARTPSQPVTIVQTKPLGVPLPAAGAPRSPSMTTDASEPRTPAQERQGPPATDGPSVHGYPVRANELPVITATTPLLLQRQADHVAVVREQHFEAPSSHPRQDSFGSTVFVPGVVESRAPVPSALQQMPMAQAVPASRAADAASSPASQDNIAAAVTPTASLPASPPGPLILQRKPAQSSGSHESAPARTASASRSAAVSVASEIRGATAAPGEARIVWRKADRDGGQRDAVRALTETRTLAHQIQMKREAAVGTASDGVVMPDLPPPPESHDYTRIAEKVSRVMARQLRVERERRGITK
jgi:hypothetical protein